MTFLLFRQILCVFAFVPINPHQTVLLYCLNRILHTFTTLSILVKPSPSLLLWLASTLLSLVYAQFLNSDASLSSESQYVQGVNHTGCSPLQYSVLSNRKQETLVLTSNGRSVAGIPSGIERDIAAMNGNNIKHYDNPSKYFQNHKFIYNMTDGVFRVAGYVPRSLQDTPVFISLSLLDCPPGFTLSDRQCDCNKRLLEHSLTCNITDQTVHRDGTTWINASFSGNSSNGVIVHQHCPFGYCKQERVDVDLANPDIQCAFHHSGTLCGACEPNFSLALGGCQCLPNCSNSYLSLLIPFALAGVALVFFINILNLTVSQGTIYGLIFYANIVAANRSIFFTPQQNKFLSFPSVFISWLNLDLGIETCFIKGLDGYWKTWLQFVFPFYIWAIAGAIILASRCSTRATKLFGKNSLSVLATLFLVSYAKLLRSVITIFSFTTLVYPDDSTSAVWAFDGNIGYLSSKHIPLFLFALVVVLLLWLPYTAVLLSALWLRTQTHRKGLRWLKPFLDAYYGPFKDKHHYWVGVLLVVRGVLFVFFASFFAVEDNVNILSSVVSCVVLLAFPGASVYKVVYLSALENSFFLNLGVLAAGTLYIRLVGGSQEALVSTSVGIAFLQFVAITAFHAYRFVIVPVGNKCRDICKSRAEERAHRVELQALLNVHSSDSGSEDEDRPKPVVTHSKVCVEDLRKEQELVQCTELASKETPQRTKGKATADHQPTPAEVKQELTNKNTSEISIPSHEPNIDQPDFPSCEPHQAHYKPKHFNDISSEILILFTRDTPHPNVPPLETADAAANEAAGAPKKSAAAAVSPDEPPPPPQESSGPPRFFAAKGYVDYTSPREPLLEFIP